MKVSFSKRVRSAVAPAVGLVALGTLTVGCGDKDSNPETASVEDLKSPTGMSIIDNGNGAVTLKWGGANNEDDFDGYNVYGAKATSAILAKKNGVVELVDKEGNAVAAARSYLENFNFDPAKGFSSKGDKKDPDAEFEFLPIHTAGEDGAPLLPTCKPTSSGCAPTTAATVGKSGAEYALNGYTTFPVTGLELGSEYCFLALSSMKKGNTVSQTSSEVRCVKPKYKATLTLKIDGTTDDDRLGINLGKIFETCKASGCPTLTAADGTSIVSAPKSQAKADTAEPLNFEDFKSDGELVYLTGGKNTAIKLVGRKVDGFSDKTLPSELPALTKWSTDLENEGGYSISGASVPVSSQYVYVVAVGTTDNPTAFKYYWLWVESAKASIGRGKTTTFQVLLPAEEGDLSLGDTSK